MASTSNGQELLSIYDITRIMSLANETQIPTGLLDGDLELVGVTDSSERLRTDLDATTPSKTPDGIASAPERHAHGLDQRKSLRSPANMRFPTIPFTSKSQNKVNSCLWFPIGPQSLNERELSVVADVCHMEAQLFESAADLIISR